jgi:phosphate ABC transporter permease protein PstC
MSNSTQAGSPFGAGLPAPPDLSRRRRPGETVIKALLLASAAMSVAITIGIVLALIQPTLDFFSQISPGDFFTFEDPKGAPIERQFAVGPLVIGTLLTTLVALALAIPIGLGAAIYLSEYASPRRRRYLKPTVELLAGVPSVVYGFFAVFFVIPTVLQGWLGLDIQFYNSLGAGLVLGVMIIPTIASLAEDSLHAVPQALRQGSLAMGANRMQTTLRVVCPAALSGIAAAIVLGLSRAVGETMIVTMAGGLQKNNGFDLGEPHMTMTGFIATRFTSEAAAVGSTPYNMLFAVGLLLFAITFLINMVSISIVRRFRQEY